MNFLPWLIRIDGLLGTLLIKLLPPTNVQKAAGIRTPSTCLIIRPGGIGDAVLLAPMIRQIKLRFPGLIIDFLVEKRNRSVIAMYGPVGQVYCYDRPLDLIKVLSRRYDAVIDTEQWYRLSAVVARLVRAGKRVGFATNARSKMFSHPIVYSLDEYEVVSFFRLLEPFGIRAELPTDLSPFLQIPREAESRAASLCVGLNPESLVVIFPGASIPQKRWGGDRFRLVGRALAEKGLTLLVVGGAEESATGMRIVADGCGVNLAGKTSLTETAAIIAHAAAVVSGDSGILHLAYALGRPTVALFGPSSVAKWAPQGARHIVIKHGLPCAPCSQFGRTPTCLRKIECLRNIAVEEVTAAVCEVLHLTKEGNTN